MAVRRTPCSTCPGARHRCGPRASAAGPDPGDRRRRGRLPRLRHGRRGVGPPSPRGRGRPLVRNAGAGALAQADLALFGAGRPCRHVQRAARLPAAGGQADQASGGVVDTAFVSHAYSRRRRLENAVETMSRAPRPRTSRPSARSSESRWCPAPARSRRRPRTRRPATAEGGMRHRGPDYEPPSMPEIDTAERARRLAEPCTPSSTSRH